MAHRISISINVKTVMVRVFILVQLLQCINVVFVSSDSEIHINRPVIGNEGMPQLTIVGERQVLPDANKRNETDTTKIKGLKEWIEFNVSYSLESPNTILSHSLERFTINCTAPYLTRWTSNIVPRLPATYGHPNRYEHNPFHFQRDWQTDDNSGIVFQSQMIFILPNGTSGFMQCESVTDSAVATKVFIFVQDGEPFVKVLQTDEFQPPIIAGTRKDFYIPCVGNYPDLNALVFQITNYSTIKTATDVAINDSERIGNYDPQRGFLMKGNNNVEQRYHCQIAPVPGKKLKLAHRAIVHFYNLELIEMQSDLQLEFHIGSTEDEYPLGIWCSSGNDTFNQIKMITCNSLYECDWLNDCFYDKCTGNEILRRTAIPYQRDQTNLKTTIKDPFTRGKVICVSAINQAVFAYQYLFLGLDRHRYWISSQNSEVPKRAIIYLQETDAILYTNKPASFACETSNFLLLSNIKFAAVFKNQSTLLLDKINTTRDPTILVDHDLGFSRKEIVINVTTEMISIMCFAPLLTSSQWVNTSRAFEVRDVKAPTIQIKPEGNKSNKLTFYEDDKTRTLTCNATGEPQPSIKWRVPKELNHVFAGFKLNNPTLHFPVINLNLKGKYICTATNIYGEDSVDFVVGVKPPTTQLGSDTMIGLIAGFVALTTGLAFAIIKYIQARKGQRDLTPEELKEFLHGNPNTDSSSNEDSMEVKIKNMGFNPAYKINRSDLSIGPIVLGQGNGGKVVKGLLIDRAVAVKTAKPNADAQYILALLSELKIMAYISEDKHPNIVEFIGAVITEIEQRRVFVVVEISPVGNLHDFLIDLGPGGFMNMLTETGDLYLRGQTLEQIKLGISILNFVSWCEQIASAMEFLASKRVIHGDLAARNILMFRNDVVKITDFGLSRKLYQSPMYKKKSKVALPMAWMAIESLRFMQFSTQSDVWSFGVTAWEMFSLAEFPYAGTPENDFVKNLLNGMRLKKPFNASRDIYNILRSCWELEPSQRPSFSDLKHFFGIASINLRKSIEAQAKTNQREKTIFPVTNTVYVTLSTEDDAMV